MEKFAAMVSPEALAVLITITILLGSLMANFNRRYVIRNVPTVDWLTRWFFRSKKDGMGLSAAACTAWALIGSVFCFGIPALAGNSFIGTPFGVIVTLSSAILAPCLVGVYVYLVKSVDQFVDQCRNDQNAFSYLEEAKGFDIISLLGKRFAFWLGHFFLLAFSIWTLYQAVLNQGVNPSPGMPWADEDIAFTYYGSIYYVLRGLHSYMVLSLLWTFVYIWYFLYKKTNYKQNLLIHDSQLNIPPIIKQICVGMALSVFLCTLSVTFHGAAITIQMLDEPEKAGVLFIKSTWVVWLVLLFIATVILYSAFSFFKNYLEISAQKILESFGADKLIDLESGIKLVQDRNHDGTVDFLDIDKFTNELNKVRELRNSIPISPITGTGSKTVYGAIIFQLINILAGITAVFIG